MDLTFIRDEWAYFTGAFVTVFFIVDPFAVIPVYLSLTDKYSDRERRSVRLRSTLIALGLLIMFAVSGTTFFGFFGITLPAFQIAGGILLFALGFTQLNAKQEKVSRIESQEGLEKDDISVFPLAMPLLAGPGAISTVILLSTKTGSVLRLLELVVAITACMFLTLLILKSSPYLLKGMGRTGLNLLSRIMGIILTAVGIQFALNGIHEAIQHMR
jgi:multiple antibiotic resistance protein